MSQGRPENEASRSNDAEAQVLDVTRRLAAELHPHPAAREITLDSLLDRELGFDSWSAAIKLRNAACAEILRHCSEPDLADQPPPA